MFRIYAPRFGTDLGQVGPNWAKPTQGASGVVTLRPVSPCPGASSLRLPGLPSSAATRVPGVRGEKTQSGISRGRRSPFVRPAVYFADDGASPGGNGRHGLYTLRDHIRIRTIRPARMGRMPRPPAQPGGILFSTSKDLGLEDMIRSKKHPGLRLDQLPGLVVGASDEMVMIFPLV